MTIRAQDMTSRQFKGLLTKIHNTGRQLDALVSQGIAYAAYHHVAHGNKAPWDALLEVAPKFAHKVIRDARAACNKTDRANVDTALPEITEVAEVALEERRTTGKSASKADDDKKAGKPNEYRLVRVVDGKREPVALTEEEYNAALAAVEALRSKKAGQMQQVASLEKASNKRHKKAVNE